MSKQDKNATKKNDPLVGSWVHPVRILLVSAAIITIYLALATLSQSGNVPGCGPDSGCDKVLNSKWAYWLGIPVSLPGLGLYTVFFASTFGIKAGNREKAKRSLNTLTLCAAGVLGAALWFVAVQALVIKAFCPYCCTAHALASVAAVLFITKAGGIGNKLSVKLNFGGATGAAVGLCALIAGGQVLLPKQMPGPKIVQLGGSETNAIPETQTNSAPETVLTDRTPQIAQTNSPVKPSTPKADLYPIPRTNLKLDATKLPLIGKRDAPNRFALMFDYTCHHCRKLHGFVRELMPKYDGKLSCLLIPVPLDAKCNSLMQTTHPDHVDACEYAKICLAVHQVAPEKYDAFDQWLFSEHDTAKPLKQVRVHADNLAGKEALGQAISSNALEGQIQKNIEAYELNSKNGGSSSMPQTIVNDRVMFGPPPSAQALDDILNQLFDLK